MLETVPSLGIENVFEVNEAIQLPIFLHICKTVSRVINFH